MADWKKLLDAAVSGAKAAGESVAQAADDARKVAGIGVGEIAINIDGPAYRGEALRGWIKLTLPDPIAAKRLVIALRAKRTRIPVENLRHKQASPLQFENVFDVAVDVEGERTYESDSTYAFSIDVPDKEPEDDVGGLIGDVLAAARAFKAMTETEIRWRLVAWLEIPWKRNLEKEVAISVNEPRPKAPAPPPPAPPPPPPPRPKVAPIPRPVALPDGWLRDLGTCLDEIQRAGGVLIHQCARPPVDPAAVMKTLANHPDVDAEVLQFYGVMDGIEIIVGRPTQPKSSYETVRIAGEIAEKKGPWLGMGGELYSSPLGDALEDEFGDDVTILEIPAFADMIDGLDHFMDFGGSPTVHGGIQFGYGDYLGLVHGDEIRSWEKLRDHEDHPYAYFWQDYLPLLRERERTHNNRWWVVRGDDHAAGLADPPLLLRWSELLAYALDHLAGR